MFKLLVTDYASYQGSMIRTTVIEFNTKEEADIAYNNLDGRPFGSYSSFVRDVTKLY